MNGPATIEDRTGIEARVYIAMFIAVSLLYLLAGLVFPVMGEGWKTFAHMMFGFSQMGCFGIPCSAIGLSIPLVVIFIGRTTSSDRMVLVSERAGRVFASPWFRAVLPLVLIGVFFALRNGYVNYDGHRFAEMFARDIPLKGSHVTHDEMWELYLHSRFWFYADRILGWSVEHSYQVLSSVAGGVFVLLLMYYCSVMFPQRPVLAFVICVSGGYMQLFFGDVENYTLTAVWIMAYFLSSALYIKGRWSLLTPSVILAAAMTFHLLAGFLIPSLLVLYRIAWNRGEKRNVLTAAALSCSILGLTLLFFHFHGLPIAHLWYHSHAFGHGGNIRPRLVDPSPGYYFQILNLLFLLAPVWILLLPQMIFGRIKLDPLNLHLIAASVFMGLFVIGWKATLGVYSDWNMFAAAALPVTFLAVRNMLSTECLRRRCWLMYLFAWLFMLHSYSWVVSNHFYQVSAG